MSASRFLCARHRIHHIRVCAPPKVTAMKLTLAVEAAAAETPSSIPMGVWHSSSPCLQSSGATTAAHLPPMSSRTMTRGFAPSNNNSFPGSRAARVQESNHSVAESSILRNHVTLPVIVHVRIAEAPCQRFPVRRRDACVFGSEHVQGFHI